MMVTSISRDLETIRKIFRLDSRETRQTAKTRTKRAVASRAEERLVSGMAGLGSGAVVHWSSAVVL